MKTVITKDEVEKIAKLANLPLESEELKKFPEQFTQTIEVVDQLKEVDTKGIEITAGVTGLRNVWREDEIDEERVLSQDEVLSQAKRSHKGYFVVERIIE